MSMSPNPTRAIAEYVHGGLSFQKLPREAIANAKLVILDTIGVMFAGSRHELGRIVTDYVRANCPTGRATVAGAGFQTSAELAALANGTMAHAHDYDSDGHIPNNWFRNQIWLKALDAAQLGFHITPHVMRHAHASWLLAGGADIQVVKERLGHASILTTQRYLHTLPENEDAALTAMARIRGTSAPA